MWLLRRASRAAEEPAVKSSLLSTSLAIRRRTEIMVNPENHVNSVEKILQDFRIDMIYMMILLITGPDRLSTRHTPLAPPAFLTPLK